MATDTMRGNLEASTRESLLDVILDKVAKQGKTYITSRIVYVARLQRRENGAEHLKAQLGKLVERHSQDGELSGMLLVYPLAYIHVLEGKTPQLMAILRELLTSHTTELKLAETKIISSTEDVPGRYFNGWYCTYVPTTSTVETMDALDTQEAVKSASSINAFLRAVGPTLAAPQDPDTRRRLQSLESHYENVPSQELLLSYGPTEDAPSVQEYLDIFDAPVNVDLESEQVWPMPPPLKY